MTWLGGAAGRLHGLVGLWRRGQVDEVPAGVVDEGVEDGFDDLDVLGEEVGVEDRFPVERGLDEVFGCGADDVAAAAGPADEVALAVAAVGHLVLEGEVVRDGVVAEDVVGGEDVALAGEGALPGGGGGGSGRSGRCRGQRR